MVGVLRLEKADPQGGHRLSKVVEVEDGHRALLAAREELACTGTSL